MDATIVKKFTVANEVARVYHRSVRSTGVTGGGGTDLAGGGPWLRPRAGCGGGLVGFSALGSLVALRRASGGFLSLRATWRKRPVLWSAFLLGCAAILAAEPRIVRALEPKCDCVETRDGAAQEESTDADAVICGRVGACGERPRGSSFGRRCRVIDDAGLRPAGHADERPWGDGGRGRRVLMQSLRC